MVNQPAYGPAEGMLPQNIEAEQAVLGSLLIDPRAIERVAAFLRPADFYLPVNGEIYQTMLALYERDMPTDIVTVSDHLRSVDRLDYTGGAAYLASLANIVPTSINVEYYARIVERLAVLRRLVDAGNRISAIGYDERLEAEEALEESERILFEISRLRVTRDFEALSKVLAELYEKLDHIHSHESEITGTTTGYIDLDRLTSGLQRSDLIILAARPSAGKTALALNMAHAVATKAGLPVGIFSIEMSAEQVAQRLISIQAQVDSQKLRSGRMSDADWDRLVQAVGVLSEAPIFVDDTPALSTAEMRSKARRLHTEQGLGLLVVDYLQLMQGATSENRVQEISAISRSLKAIARELDIPVLALSQLSRAPEQRPNHEPMLSDLRESGCLAGETLVYLPDDGIHRRIDELVGRSGFNVLALNMETWQLEPRPVLRAFSTGRKPVFKLILGTGRSLRATANHRFLTVLGWKRLDEFEAGTRIALPRILFGPDRPTMTEDEPAPYEQEPGALPVYEGIRPFPAWDAASVAPRYRAEAQCGSVTVHSQCAPARELVVGASCVRPLLPPGDVLGYTRRTQDAPTTPASIWRDDRRTFARPYWAEAIVSLLLHTILREAAPGLVNCPVGAAAPSLCARAGDTPPQRRTETELQPLQMPGAESRIVAEDAWSLTPIQSDDLDRLAHSDVYWDKIVSIEPDGESDVYDLTVEGHHNFVANGIVVHNSLEQDSDIVMFIYRDVLYNPDTERPHVADIIVAKHRNGPTGRVHLFFQESFMRFLDLSVRDDG